MKEIAGKGYSHNITQKLTVLMTIEGAYPFHSGGLSRMCDDLVQGMPWIDYLLMPLTNKIYEKPIYTIPNNVKGIYQIPLLTIKPVAPWHRLKTNGFSIFSKRKERKLISNRVKSEFVPLFKKFIQNIISDNPEPKTLADILLKMYYFFQECDFHKTFESPDLWKTYKEEIQNHLKGIKPSFNVLLYGFNLFYNFLSTLRLPVPRSTITHSTAAALCGIPCIISKLRDGTPMLLTEQGVYLRDRYFWASSLPAFYKRLYVRLLHAIVRLNYYFADQIATCCDYNIKWELAHGADRSKIVTIYNGVDTRIYRPLEIKDPSVNRIVTVARLYAVKDIKTLIYTASLVSKKIPNVQFWVYGPQADPSYYQECLSLVSMLDLKEIVIFKGPTHNIDHTVSAYNQATLMLLTTRSEGMPYTVLEAMSCGKPVIASDVGGVSEILEGCGILVKPRDSEGFAEAVVKLLTNPDLCKKIGQQSLERIHSRFAIEKCVEGYAKSYLHLAQCRKHL